MLGVWQGDLARLVAGASPPDGQGGWTLPPERRLRHIAELRTRVRAEEGARLAAAIEQEVRRALVELEALVPDGWVKATREAREAREARERAASEAREARSRRSREQTPRRLATMRANGNRAGKPVGKHMTAITEDLIREAHELYSVGRDDQGRPLSVRKVAAIILPRTTYASAKACANCLHEAWKARGWPTRDRVAATRAATITHGELIGTKDWRDPVAAEKKNEYRRRRRALDPKYARGKQATTTNEGGPHGSRNHTDGQRLHGKEAAVA